MKKKSRRRPKTLPPEQAQAQTLARMKAAAAAAARKTSLYTRGGRTFARLPNGGFSGSCGPTCLLQLAMKRDGVPIPVIEEATNGELKPEVLDALQHVRDITVEKSHGHDLSCRLDPDDECEIHSFEELVDGADLAIMTKAIWDRIMRSARGYFDGTAVMIGADALDLDGLVIVRLDSDGFMVAVDGTTTPIADAKHVIFWDGYAHFEAICSEEELYPVSYIDGKWSVIVGLNASLSTYSRIVSTLSAAADTSTFCFCLSPLIFEQLAVKQIFPDVGEEFFFDGHAHPEGIVVEELPPVSAVPLAVIERRVCLCSWGDRKAHALYVPWAYFNSACAFTAPTPPPIDNRWPTWSRNGRSTSRPAEPTRLAYTMEVSPLTAMHRAWRTWREWQTWRTWRTWWMWCDRLPLLRKQLSCLRTCCFEASWSSAASRCCKASWKPRGSSWSSPGTSDTSSGNARYVPSLVFVPSLLVHVPRPPASEAHVFELSFCSYSSSRVNCFHRLMWMRHGTTGTRASRPACRVGPTGADLSAIGVIAPGRPVA